MFKYTTSVEEFILKAEEHAKNCKVIEDEDYPKEWLAIVEEMTNLKSGEEINGNELKRKENEISNNQIESSESKFESIDFNLVLDNLSNSNETLGK
jgi:hypothetical protein